MRELKQRFSFDSWYVIHINSQTGKARCQRRPSVYVKKDEYICMYIDNKWYKKCSKLEFILFAIFETGHFSFNRLGWPFKYRNSDGNLKSRPRL